MYQNEIKFLRISIFLYDLYDLEKIFQKSWKFKKLFCTFEVNRILRCFKLAIHIFFQFLQYHKFSKIPLSDTLLKPSARSSDPLEFGVRCRKIYFHILFLIRRQMEKFTIIRNKGVGRLGSPPLHLPTLLRIRVVLLLTERGSNIILIERIMGLNSLT